MASFVVENEGPQMEEFEMAMMEERAEKAYGEKLPQL